MSKAAKVAAIRRRRDLLARRVARDDLPAVDWHTHNELAAMEWVVPIVEDLLARNSELALDVHRVARESTNAWLASVAVESLARLDPAQAAELLARASEGPRERLLKTIDRRDPELACRLRERVAGFTTHSVRGYSSGVGKALTREASQ